MPPAACYRYSPDRKGIHPQRHLAPFRGVLHADGYAGFKTTYNAGGGEPRVLEAACRAHVRRKFFEFANSGKAPQAEAAPKVAALKTWLERQLAWLPA